MSTAPAPTGALSRRGTHEPTGPQTKPFDTIRRPFGRMPIGLVLDVLAVGVQLVFTVDGLASGQISYGGCISTDGSGANFLASTPRTPQTSSGSLISLARPGPQPTTTNAKSRIRRTG